MGLGGNGVGVAVPVSDGRGEGVGGTGVRVGRTVAVGRTVKVGLGVRSGVRKGGTVAGCRLPPEQPPANNTGTKSNPANHPLFKCFVSFPGGSIAHLQEGSKQERTPNYLPLYGPAQQKATDPPQFQGVRHFFAEGRPAALRRGCHLLQRTLLFQR